MSLEGPRVRLVPLDASQAAAFFEIGRDEDIWRYLSGAPFTQLRDAEHWLNRALVATARGNEFGFAVIDKASDALAGTTRYLDIRTTHKGIEIGSTWYSRRFWRTHVNTETKYLLLRHAFEDWNANRVQFVTDARNLRSQQAIERIGAQREGLLRQHKACPDGHVRDSVVYSVVRSDWPRVNRHLEQLMRDGANARVAAAVLPPTLLENVT